MSVSVRSRSLRNTLLRCVALLVVATVLPSCSDDSGDGGPVPMDLFIDDFDAGLGNWTIVSPSVTIKSTGELRPPSMQIIAQGGVPGEARTTATFSAASLTISIDVFPGSSIAEFLIVDNLNPTLVDTYAIISDNSVHYSIGGQTKKIDFAPDPFAHKFLFHVEFGTATWQRDGKTQMTGVFAPATVFLDCRDLETGSLFDLVHVSTP